MLRGVREEWVAADGVIWIGDEGHVDRRLRLRSLRSVASKGLLDRRRRAWLVVWIVHQSAVGRSRERMERLASVHGGGVGGVRTHTGEVSELGCGVGLEVVSKSV
jgi:hypothetical protein